MSSPQMPEKREFTIEERLTMDPVTGLRNEYLFRLRLPDEFSLAREREMNGALMVIKLDRIIEINEHFGRMGGDEALRALSRVLQDFQGAKGHSSHLLFKLSGPVFGYYIPVCTDEQSRAAARDILKCAYESEAFMERITVSIGIANLYEFFLREEDSRRIALLIEQTAMRRLALAEKSGMNTVCHVSEIPGSLDGDKPTILVVDPDPYSIELLLHALESAKFEVEKCQDGETAFASIQAKPPSAIVCEAMTPRLNGFTIRERLRANVLWNSIPFILVSHKKTEELVRKAVELDIRFYFRKPLSIAEIVGLLSNILRSKTA
jgi:diguanylate cyclase (GGDEF)-like protein